MTTVVDADCTTVRHSAVVTTLSLTSLVISNELSVTTLSARLPCISIQDAVVYKMCQIFQFFSLVQPVLSTVRELCGAIV